MIRGVAFDLEGTTVNVEFAHFKALRQAAKEVGVYFDPSNTAEDMARRIPNAIGGGDGVNSEGIARLADPEAPIAEIRKRAMQIRARKDHFYNEIIEGLEAIEPREGFLQVLAQIRSYGLPTAIASMTDRKQADVLLDRSGIDKLFPRNLILLRDSVENIKPAPDVYLEAARRMEIAPPEMLVFEDSVTGITAARRAGSCAVAMPVYTFPANIEALKKAGSIEIFDGWEKIDDTTLTALLNI